MLPFNLAISDATSANPVNGFLSGGFVWAPQRQLGGSGNSQSQENRPTATLTPTGGGGPGAVPVVPFADGLMGFGGGAAVSSAGAASSLLLPAALLGAALLIAVAIRK